MDILEKLENFILKLKAERDMYKKELEKLKKVKNGKRKISNKNFSYNEVEKINERLTYMEKTISDLLLTIENLYKKIDLLERKVLFLERKIK